MQASEEVIKRVTLTMTPEDAHELCRFIGATSVNSRADILNKNGTLDDAEQVASRLGRIYDVLEDLGYCYAK